MSISRKIGEAAKIKRRIDELTKKLDAIKAEIRLAAVESGLSATQRQVEFDSPEGKCTVVYVDNKLEEAKGTDLDALLNGDQLDPYLRDGLLYKKPSIRPKAFEFYETLDRGHKTALEGLFDVKKMEPRVSLPK